MTLKVSTATGTVCAVTRFPEKSFFIVKKNLRNLRPIFLLVIYDCSCLYRLAKRPRVTTRDVCYTRVNCSFQKQRFVNIACMELRHL